jgi:hypothetical protein
VCGDEIRHILIEYEGEISSARTLKVNLIRLDSGLRFGTRDSNEML